MKLLIPNAKELNTNQDAFSYQELSQKPQAILDILTNFSVEDLTNFYKINSNKAEQDYLDEHLRIATAFYGLVKPTDLIAPHRLDFQGKLKIGKTSLKQFWREDYDKVVQDDDLIISLLSSEFEQVFSPDIRKRMIKIIFMENRAGKLKIHSTISKKGRGRLVSLMAEKQIETLEDIKTLSFDGFSFSLEHSDDKTITFIRDGE